MTEEGAREMHDALASVAQLNHIPVRRRSFRHGSMAVRQERLRRLVGAPLHRLPIDRTVRWIKGGIVVGLLLALAGAFVEIVPMGMPRREDLQRAAMEREMMTPRFLREWRVSSPEDAP